MNLKFLIDMNLSPAWVSVLEDAGWAAVHWSQVGDPKASDRVVMDWAAANGCVVFTNDLDFGTLLALTYKSGPSVLQMRAQNLLPDQSGTVVIAAIRQHERELASGALMVIDEGKNRVRILPI